MSTEQLAQALRDLIDATEQLGELVLDAEEFDAARAVLAKYEAEKGRFINVQECEYPKGETAIGQVSMVTKHPLCDAPAAPVASPVLVRDVVDMLGTTVRAVSAAFVAMGHAPRSTNMAVTGEEAVQVAAHLRAAHAAHAAGTQGEPVAARHDFDGYGYRYIDNGSGSDWQTRIPDAEMLYTESDEAEIRADERERCAKLCEFEASKCGSPKLAKLLTKEGRQIKEAQGVGAMNCANAIRRIGTKGNKV